MLDEIKVLLKKFGVVGAGGAGFPTYAKLNRTIKTIILNGAECEPLFNVDKTLLKEKTFEILKGLNVIVESLNAEVGIITFKEQYEEIDEAIDNLLYKFPKLNKKLLKDSYPTGDEIVLIYETIGLIVPQGEIPASVGCMVVNVETALNIYNAKFNRETVINKYVIVRGEVRNSKLLKVPVGTKINDLVKLCGGISIKNYKVLIGGVMTGNLGNLEDVITKTTKGIFILPKDNPVIKNREINAKISLKRAMSVCSQCRMCTDLCPRNLLGYSIEPHKIMNSLSFSLSYDTDTIINSLACCECNLCSMYSCHQGLDPKGLIGELKIKLRNNNIRVLKEMTNISKDREYKRIPINRLIYRLNLEKYDVNAPLEDVTEKVYNVKLMLKQSIGEKVVPIIKINEYVEVGQCIGQVEDDRLGVFLHSPIKGIVTNINEDFIEIRKEE